MFSRLLKKFLLGLIGAVVITVGLLMRTATTATTTFHYEITDLGSLSINGAQAHNTNNAGQVVGDYRGHAFLWQNGQMTDLGILSDSNRATVKDIQLKSQLDQAGDKAHLLLTRESGFSTTNSLQPDAFTTHTFRPCDCSHAQAINNKGQVVGYSWVRDGNLLKPFHGFLWDEGKMIDLGTFGNDTYGWAIDINNRGQVVGYSSTYPYANPTQAFLWSNGTKTSLGSLGGVYTNPSAINDRGQIVGSSSYLNMKNFADHAFLWFNGKMIDLHIVRRDHTSTANDINNKGQVVGSYMVDNNGVSSYSHAFLWQNRRVTDLGTLGFDSFATGINNAGKVVGASRLAQSSLIHAFVWYKSKMTDLNSLIPPNSGWVLEIATAINDKGQIVGNGTFNGQQYKAFLLTPVAVTQ